MHLAIRLSVIALFGLAIGGAALIGLRAGREEALRTQPDLQVTALPSATNTDQQIAGLLARIERLPESAEAHTSLGAAYLQKARESGDPSFYARAEAVLNQSLALDDASAETYLQLGVLALARHQFEDALTHGRRAQELNPYKAAALGVIGDAQVELGRYEEAAATFQAMMDRRPDLASFARLSYMRELQGDLPGAIALMERAVIGAPGSEAHAWTQVQLGHLYFASGDLDAAEKEYERTLFQRPGYLHARAGLARVVAARGDYAGAAEIYREVTQTMPLPEYVIALADVQQTAGDDEGAAQTEALVLAMDRLFRESGVNTDVEMALFRADRDIDIAETVADAQTALATRPGVHVWDVLAWALYKAGRHEEAQAASDRALRLGTRDPLMRYHAGMIALALGQTERAAAELRLAVSPNPTFSVRYGVEAARVLAELEKGAAAGR